TSAQENLVHVVVQDDTKPLQVMTAKRSADLFCEGIANRVGMTDSLALDHLHILRIRPGSFSGTDSQFQPSLPQSGYIRSRSVSRPRAETRPPAPRDLHALQYQAARAVRMVRS